MKKIECPFCGTVNVFYPKPYEFHMVNGWRKAVRRGKCECCGHRFEYYFHDDKPYYLPAGWMDGDPKIPAYIRQKGDGELNCPVCHENFNHGIHAHKIKERTIVNYKHPQANPKTVDVYGKRCHNCDAEFEYYYDPWAKEFKYYKKIDIENDQQKKNKCRDCKHLCSITECNGRGRGECNIKEDRWGHKPVHYFSDLACRFFEPKSIDEIFFGKKKEEEKMGPDAKTFQALNLYYCMPELPKAKSIKFNGPATIIFWDDGTKTVVKCQEEDVYDLEKGVLICTLKKFIGMGELNRLFDLMNLASLEELVQIQKQGGNQ